MKSSLSRAAARALHRVYDLRRRVASEETFIKRVLEDYSGSGKLLLDVGCGYCRFYSMVTSCGFRYIGIDENTEIVNQNVFKGIECLSSSAEKEHPAHVDVLLFSHIIEHFDYRSLVDFLNPYLLKLRIGGIVIILTPILHRGFYDDFDHVKPYSPGAVRQAFVAKKTQTQDFRIRGTFDEMSVWFKRDTPWHSFRESRWMHLIKVPLSLLSTITFGRIGRLTGYGIVLRKTYD